MELTAILGKSSSIFIEELQAGTQVGNALLSEDVEGKFVPVDTCPFLKHCLTENRRSKNASAFGTVPSWFKLWNVPAE